jgi:TIR domain
VGEEHRDFFISYTSTDRAWAEWIAWELEAAGYTTLIQAWDFRPGTDWAIKMQEGTTEWSRILAEPKALDASLSALSSLLDLPQANEREQDVQIKAVLGWLQGHERWLLIADNADTEPAAMAIRDRFPPKLPGAVLVTSRLSRWPVNTPNLPLEVLSREDAVRYLLDRVAKEEHQAGDEAAAHGLADELGHLPLALEQAASFVVEMRWSFAKYQEQFRDTRPELLSEHREGGTRYPASVAKTWSITLDQIGSLARSLLRIAAWFAPDAIPRGLFSAEPNILAEALSEKVTTSDLAIEKALGELDKFSFIRLTAETVSMHPLLQAVEQDSMGADERERWLGWAARLFNAFAPASPNDVRTCWVSQRRWR